MTVINGYYSGSSADLNNPFLNRNHDFQTVHFAKIQ